MWRFLYTVLERNITNLLQDYIVYSDIHFQSPVNKQPRGRVYKVDFIAPRR